MTSFSWANLAAVCVIRLGNELETAASSLSAYRETVLSEMLNCCYAASGIRALSTTTKTVDCPNLTFSEIGSQSLRPGRLLDVWGASVLS